MPLALSVFIWEEGNNIRISTIHGGGAVEFVYKPNLANHIHASAFKGCNCETCIAVRQASQDFFSREPRKFLSGTYIDMPFHVCKPAWAKGS